MTVNELMDNKKITKYRLSKDSGVAYTTVNDICSGRAQLEKCSAETVYRIAKALGVSMESLIEPCFDKRCDFELFKSWGIFRLSSIYWKGMKFAKITRRDGIVKACTFSQCWTM